MITLIPTKIFSINYLVSIFLLAFICVRLHEYAHLIPYWLQGKSIRASLGTVMGYGNYSLASDIAGPLLSYTLIWSGMALLLASEKMKMLGFELIFAATPLYRLTGWMLSTFPGRDELSIARSLQISPLLAGILVLTIILPPLAAAYFSIDSKLKPLWFASFFVGLPVIIFVFVLLPDKYFLDPIVRGLSPEEMSGKCFFHGIPIAVYTVDFLALLGFLFMRRLTSHSPNKNISGELSSRPLGRMKRQ